MSELPPDAGEPEHLAALDLGSNSFHMVVAKLVDGEPVLVDRIREQVQLAAGLGADRALSDEAADRAVACLARFGQRLAEMPTAHVRAVGTNTLRAARHADRFLERAEQALGHPIEVVSGKEEARLVYLGVAHDLSDDQGYRLVVDIGGGSTELILGERFETLEAHSHFMGCINMTRRHFPDGAITKDALREATLAACRELSSVERRLKDIGWSSAVGSSGTIKAAASVLRAQGWADGGITVDGLARLRKAVLAAGHVDALSLPGLKSERAPVFVGGLAILQGVFDSLGLERMQWSSGAMREGVLYDLLGRIRHEDVRERTIQRLQERYSVDQAHAERVERTAQRMLEQVRQGWDLASERASLFLGWAARLHELGLAVSHSQNHRHGAYLLTHSDLPGFSNDDQRLLALLVGAHRRRLHLEVLESLSKTRARAALRLMVLLRLAVLFNRSRSPRPRPLVRLEGGEGSLTLGVPGEWLDAHPLTRADLDEERGYLAAVDFGLVVEQDELPAPGQQG